MITFIDFETSNLINKFFRNNLEWEGHPHIASVGLAAYTDDLQHQVGSFYAMIRPDGWTMDPGAEEKNGLSQGMLETYGIPIRHALNIIDAYFARSSLAVAFNMDFDGWMYNMEIYRLKRQNWLPEEKQRCAMKACSQIMQLPGKYDDYAWPKLSAAYAHFTGKESVGDHHGLWDVYNLVEIVQTLNAQGLWRIAELPPA